MQEKTMPDQAPEDLDVRRLINELMLSCPNRTTRVLVGAMLLEVFRGAKARRNSR